MTQPTNDNPGRQAAEQAKAYDSPFKPTNLVLDDGTTIEIPPHPNLRMLDDDRLAAYEELLFETESYDRAEIHLPQRTVKDDDGTEMVLPAETKPGLPLIPYRKDGQLITPPHNVRVVQVVLGEQEYARLRAGTINGRRASSADVWQIWNEQGLRLTERAAADPKSDASTGVLEKVAETDSQRPVEVPPPADS